MLENKILSLHKFFVKKKRRSNGIFIFLNVLAFFIVAGVVILNLYAIRKNPAHGNNKIILMFVLTSILSGISGVISALLSFFVFRKKAKAATEKIKSISYEKNMWKNKQARYADANRDQIIIDRILKIIES